VKVLAGFLCIIKRVYPFDRVITGRIVFFVAISWATGFNCQLVLTNLKPFQCVQSGKFTLISTTRFCRPIGELHRIDLFRVGLNLTNERLLIRNPHIVTYCFTNSLIHQLIHHQMRLIFSSINYQHSLFDFGYWCSWSACFIGFTSFLWLIIEFLLFFVLRFPN